MKIDSRERRREDGEIKRLADDKCKKRRKKKGGYRVKYMFGGGTRKEGREERG